MTPDISSRAAFHDHQPAARTAVFQLDIHTARQLVYQ
jgi:hypothetical protein